MSEPHNKNAHNMQCPDAALSASLVKTILDTKLCKELADSLEDIVLETDVFGRFVAISSRSMDILGYIPETLHGKTLADLVFFPDGQRHLQSFSRALRHHTPFVLKRVLVLHQKGLPTEWAGRPFFSSGGEFAGFRVLCRDASEQTHMEIVLRQSEEKFRAVFDLNPMAMAILDPQDGCFLEVNRQFEAMMGFCRKEFMGRTPCEFEEEHGFRGLSGMLKGVHQKDLDLRLLRKGGKDIICRLSHWHMRISNKPYILLGFTDVTWTRMAQARLEHLTHRDVLTGLYNRAFCESKMLELDTPQHLPLSIIMGDVNGLMLTNNGFGREQGDDLLRHIARILTASSRRSDTVCRWGGDEFVVLLPQTAQSLVQEMCETIRQRCKNTTGLVITPSLALGSATKREDTEDFEGIVRLAENRMHGNKLVEGKSVRSSIVASLLSALGEREHGTEQHAHQLEMLGRRFGRYLRLAPDKIDRLALLAALHDIGKLDVRPELLQKEGPLSAVEWEDIKRHPEVGYRIVRLVPELSHVAEAILAHHERWDGRGYPYGLSGASIPFLSRFIAVVDAFDVMVTGRPYRRACTEEEAVKELQANAGTQFDPKIVAAFVRYFETTRNRKCLLHKNNKSMTG